MPHVTLGGHALYFECRGRHDPERDTVVFLHDGLGAVGSWKDVPERIVEPLGANALVYDRWGYGRSDLRPDFPFGFMEAEVPILAALLDHFRIARAHLVGHSDGGSIALMLAARHAKPVRSLVTEAAHTFVEPLTQAGIRTLVNLRTAGQTPPWLHKLHGDRSEAILDAWSASWLSASHTRWTIQEDLGQIEVPALVIQGDRDEFGTEAQVRSIAERVPAADFWLVPDCGHTPHVEHANAFVSRVTEFLVGQIRR